MRLPALLSLAVLAAVSTGCDRVRVVSQTDAGPVCDPNEVLVNGACRFVCRRDGDCNPGMRCNLLVGSCETWAPVDAGEQPVPCTEGAVRCAPDSQSVQRCEADGGWNLDSACAPPDGFCQNERCLACRPGTARCAAAANTLEICTDDGSAWRQVPCAAGASCVMAECAECASGQKRCSPTNTAVQECHRQNVENLTWHWANVGDNFDGTCITQQCTPTPVPACVAPQCIPGSTSCVDTMTVSICGATGFAMPSPCSTVLGSPSAECQNGACVDECADAARAKSYFGCDYWTTVMDNETTASVFKGGVTSGQGALNQPSEFAFVVANRSTLPTAVTITRKVGGALQTLPLVNVPGRGDPATKGVAVIKVPWQSIGPDPVSNNGSSGLAAYAYRLQTNHPVTVYQFNPLAAVGTLGTCNNVNQCSEQPSGYGQTCTGGKCNYYSYSNDASLLLPAHIFGTSYVGLTPEHVIGRTGSTTGTPSSAFNGTLTIVSPAAGTTVRVKASARTLAGTGVTAMAVGETRDFTLGAYDVLQLSSDKPTNVVSGSTAGNLECGDDPFYFDPTGLCSFLGTCDQLCRVSSDLTGTIITSPNSMPFAVFGGSQCTLRGYNDAACDHVEEQLFPFVTWGQNFIAPRTAPLRLQSNAFATAAQAGPDYYKIVAGCPASTCAQGTTLTLSPAPAAADVLSQPAGLSCVAGTSLAANNCRLMGGGFVEFRSKTSFKITANYPIQVGQMFAGQNATLDSSGQPAAQGDPSLVLLPPIEQWRANYTVLTAPGIKDNYLGLVIDDSRVLSVLVDNSPVSGWVNVGTTTFKSVNVPVTVGTHTIQVNPRAGQTVVPGAGVTVYGFDSYVSYGYTGGLDLGSIVTGINPGG